MKKILHAIAIIPARYNAKRFPGKPLVHIGKKPMIQHVYERAKKITPHVYVATDDIRIQQAVENFKGKVIMTSPTCKNGTERCIEALNKIENRKNINIVLNIQGDEPIFPVSACRQMLSCFTTKKIDIATLASTINTHEEIFDPDTVKIVLNEKNFAQYFSRSPIPYIANIPQKEWLKNHNFYKHIGLYAFQKHIFTKLTHLAPTPLEKAESLEQNRWLSHGYAIKLIHTHEKSISIDTPQDLTKLNNFV